ncbi:MAG: type II toxin-antitoxin system PemK/MazF family toxin [Synergistaceae bacterium]|jgi:mRNA-degrading endonuclease toxin of MazEF toxin-antitoxin module|nr:type II toxin-antitoxin system PemK/MazF family toxin [Synergistaceae bacterium]
MCEQIKSLDIRQRSGHFIEKLPEDTLKHVLEIIFAEMDQ